MKRDLGYAVIAAVSIAAVLILGQIATFPHLEPWYAGLAKPSFNPPNWLFGPTWTALYLLMGFALWRVLRSAAPLKRVAVLLFYGQLLLNAAWSWMFFAAENPGAGLANIIPQWFMVVATAAAFWRVDRIAGLCLIPLVAWVGFATALNFELWRLNG
ncbi:TspO/MBR family protein [Dongia sp. agr-C8]